MTKIKDAKKKKKKKKKGKIFTKGTTKQKSKLIQIKTLINCGFKKSKVVIGREKFK